ncbi:hypothetical protein GUJ93_ZPchr0006g45676 [Zizania palustris]|uniref:Uncharacterized protein n=1 Tax=Zizania palustris TaxID=103762 RepID=A0A8J5TB11_ZIZPA|nr:hypothetical protein GUJ93_ZPchr0006g45676 [Zizania palustris]
MSISLDSTDGRVFGSGVAGILVTASPIQEEEHKQRSNRSSNEFRLDTQRPCAVCYLWEPYNLFRPSSPALEE